MNLKAFYESELTWCDDILHEIIESSSFNDREISISDEQIVLIQTNQCGYEKTVFYMNRGDCWKVTFESTYGEKKPPYFEKYNEVLKQWWLETDSYQYNKLVNNHE